MEVYRIEHVEQENKIISLAGPTYLKKFDHSHLLVHLESRRLSQKTAELN